MDTSLIGALSDPEIWSGDVMIVVVKQKVAAVCRSQRNGQKEASEGRSTLEPVHES